MDGRVRCKRCFAVLFLASTAQAFLPVPVTPRCVLRRGAVHGIKGRAVAMNGVVDAVNAYVDIWSPTIKSFGAPELLIKWFHGLNMGIVLTTMASFGTYLGWKIRAGEGESFQFTGKTAKELHPTLMGLAFLFFFLGGQGGLVFMDTLDKPTLQSPHAITATIGIALLAVQALLPRFFEKNESVRSVHAYLGSATMALLFVHMSLGIKLGLSL